MPACSPFSTRASAKPLTRPGGGGGGRRCARRAARRRCSATARPMLLTGRGGILLRMVKPAREREPAAAAAELERLGIPLLGSLEAPAYADAGDRFWLDDTTVAVGLGYRTNSAGATALAELMAPEGVRVETYDMPHDQGPGSVLHLQSFLSGVDAGLLVVYEPLAPVRLLQHLRDRGADWIAIDHDSYLGPWAAHPGRAPGGGGHARRRSSRAPRAGAPRHRGARLRWLGAVAQGRRRPHLPHPAAAARRLGAHQSGKAAVAHAAQVGDLLALRSLTRGSSSTFAIAEAARSRAITATCSHGPVKNTTLAPSPRRPAICLQRSAAGPGAGRGPVAVWCGAGRAVLWRDIGADLPGERAERRAALVVDLSAPTGAVAVGAARRGRHDPRGGVGREIGHPAAIPGGGRHRVCTPSRLAAGVPGDCLADVCRDGSWRTPWPPRRGFSRPATVPRRRAALCLLRSRRPTHVVDVDTGPRHGGPPTSRPAVTEATPRTSASWRSRTPWSRPA